VSEIRGEETLEHEPETEGREPEPDGRGIPKQLGIGALARDTTIYGGTRVLLKSLTFFLVPLYAHYLTRDQFGVLALVLATVALVDVIISANLDGVLSRFYFDRDDEHWRRQVITLYLFISATYPAVVIGVLVLLAGQLDNWILAGAGSAVLFAIALSDLYLTNIVDLSLILARLRRKPYTFAFYSLTRGVVQIALAIVFVAVLSLGVKGILLASLIAVCVVFVVSAREYVHDLTRNVTPSVGREMVSFAWPGVIGGVSFYAINFADRFFVRHYHGLADTGVYDVAYRYAQIVLLAVIAFRMGWPQWHYSWLHTDRHPTMVARGANYYFLAVGFLAVGVAAWILPLLHLLFRPEWWDASKAVAPLGLAAIATGAYSVFAIGFMITKRMRILPGIILAGGLLALGLNLLLIPPYSFVGAAWATAVSFAALALAVAAVGGRIYPVPWHWWRIGGAYGLALILGLASLAVDAWMPMAASLPVRLLIVLAYPVALWLAGFFPPGDIAAIRTRLRRGSAPPSPPAPAHPGA
jgi:O-antigen/teichoic acid export membrane protein